MNGSLEMVILWAELEMALLDYIYLQSAFNTKFEILVLLFPFFTSPVVLVDPEDRLYCTRKYRIDLSFVISYSAQFKQIAWTSKKKPT